MHPTAPSEYTVAERGSTTDQALRPPFAEGRVPRPPHSPPASPTTKSGTFDSGAIPGRPIVPASMVVEYVRKELLTERLDRIFLHLWWAGRPGNISPLHAQKVMKRDIVLTENVDLHLVWFDTTYYVKPLPEWLLDWHFYARVPCDDKELWHAANGLLRTYIKLVRHPSDFRIARELGLLPDCLNTWEDWSGFVASVHELGGIPDIDVSKRYHYGELRLRRLNQIYRVFHRKNYHSVYLQYDQFFSKNFAWLVLFVAYLSVVLSAMQVVLATSIQNMRFEDVAYWVSNAALVFIAATIGLQLLLLVVLFVYHLVCTVLNLEKKEYPWIGRRRGRT
jgi:hypothetical protein